MTDYIGWTIGWHLIATFARGFALLSIALASFIFASAPASACAGPHCDPNWAFQMEMQRRRDQEHHEMVVWESHRRQMEGYGSQQSGSSSGPVPPPPSEPPRYVPPPPPKGWQSRFTGFVTFKIGQDEDQDPSRFRYDYAIAMNYGSAEEAKAAATNLCRERCCAAGNRSTSTINASSPAMCTRTPFYRWSRTGMAVLGFMISRPWSSQSRSTARA